MGDRVNLTLKERLAVFDRDGHVCQYCGARAPSARLFVDHIVPVVDGGTNVFTNLITACFECNAGKGAAPINPIFGLRVKVWSAVRQLPHEWWPTESRRREITYALVDTIEQILPLEDGNSFALEAAQLGIKSWEEWQQYCHDHITEYYVHHASPGRRDGYIRFCRADLDSEHTRRFRPWVARMAAIEAAKSAASENKEVN